MKTGYYKKPIENIISDVISAMDFTVNILKAVQNGNVWTLNVDDCYHAQAGAQNIVTIGGFQYTIVSVSYANGCNSCDVIQVRDDSNGGNPITATSFSMYAPFFFYGTINETTAELSQQSDDSLKTPMYFLQLDETLDETFYEDPEDSHDRLSNINFFAFVQNDYDQVTTTLLSQGVNPARRLFENFIEQLKETYGVFEKWDFDIRLKYYTKAYVGKSGANLFGGKLSGVGASLPLKILRPQQ